jgi:hypothetical protein
MSFMSIAKPLLAVFADSSGLLEGRVAFGLAREAAFWHMISRPHSRVAHPFREVLQLSVTIVPLPIHISRVARRTWRFYGV